MLFGIYWYEWAACVVLAVLIGGLPHALWPGHRNPFALRDSKKEKKANGRPTG